MWLFYALQVKEIAHFENPDASAVTFAMAVHSIMEHELDLEQLGQSDQGKMMDDFIEAFCAQYAMPKCVDNSNSRLVDLKVKGDL